MTARTKEEIPPFVASLVLLGTCVFMYYNTGWFGYDFPTTQVLIAMPISILIWLLCAITDPPKYRHPLAALGSIVFGATIMTAAFLMFPLK